MTQNSNSNIEKQIREIWRSTFGDTPEYVDLLFNAYFNEQLCSWITHDKVDACGVGIPYYIVSDAGEKLRGLYLCGLATIPEMRRRGLMTRLLEQMENNARKRGFDATFLIPADDELRNFYSKRGYKNTSKRALISLEKWDNLRVMEQDYGRPQNREGIKLTVLKNDEAKISELAVLASHTEILYNEPEDSIQSKSAVDDYNCSNNTEQKNIINKIQNSCDNILKNKVSNKLQNNTNNKIQNNRFYILHKIKDYETVIKEKLLSKSLIILGTNNNKIILCSIFDKDGKVWQIIGNLKLQIKLLHFISNCFSNKNNNLERFLVNSQFQEDLTNFLNDVGFSNRIDRVNVEAKIGSALKIVIDNPELIDEYEKAGDGLIKFYLDDDPSSRASVTLRYELENFGMIKFMNDEKILIRENRIFESDCDASRKYWKNGNTSKNQKNLIVQPESVSFRLMLD